MRGEGHSIPQISRTRGGRRCFSGRTGPTGSTLTCGDSATRGFGKSQYNFAHIAQASADIQATNRNINSMLDQLKADITPMTAEWEGSSASAYQTAQRRWDAAAAELNTVLQSISRAVGDANSRMSQINTSAANSWS